MVRAKSNEIDMSEQNLANRSTSNGTSRIPAPRLKVKDRDGISEISIDQEDPAHGQALLMKALGTNDEDFYFGVMRQLADAAGQGDAIPEDGLNFLLSIVKGVEPRDQVESMLACQMAAIHSSMMATARLSNHVETISQQDSAGRLLNQLARTFSKQLEALKRYRTGGEQKVTVEHVTVNEGGQAIVGNVSHGGRGTPKKEKPTP